MESSPHRFGYKTFLSSCIAWAFHRTPVPIFPDRVFSSLETVEQFWVDLRQHCKSVFFADPNVRPIGVTSVAIPGPFDPDLLQRIPPEKFPELYTELNWHHSDALSPAKEEMLSALDSDCRVDTELALNHICDKYFMTTGKAGWFLAKLHFSFIRDLLESIDMNDPWRPVPMERRQSFSLLTSPAISTAGSVANKPRKRQRCPSMLLPGDDQPVGDVDAITRARPRDLRSKFTGSDNIEVKTSEQNSATPDAVDSPKPSKPPSMLPWFADLDRLSPRPVSGVRRRTSRRLTHKSAESASSLVVSDLSKLPRPVEHPPSLPVTWTNDLVAVAKRAYIAGVSCSPADIQRLVEEPRLICLLTTMKMILLHPDDSYSASAGRKALDAFSDGEVEWAFQILLKCHLVVNRKGLPGMQAIRGYFGISSKASDMYRNPTYPMALRDSLHNHYSLRATMSDCQADSVASSLMLAASGTCRIRSNDHMVDVEGDDLSLQAVADAWDKSISSGPPDLIDIVSEQPPELLCDALLHFIEGAGSDGRDLSSVMDQFVDVSPKLVYKALDWLENYSQIHHVDNFATTRWVHHHHAVNWVIDGCLRRSWTLLDGNINQQLIGDLLWMISSYICHKPGADRQSLVSLCQILSPLEIDVLLHCLELDGLIWHRSVLQRHPLESSTSNYPFTQTYHRFYFASTDCLLRT